MFMEILVGPLPGGLKLSCFYANLQETFVKKIVFGRQPLISSAECVSPSVSNLSLQSIKQSHFNEDSFYLTGQILYL